MNKVLMSNREMIPVFAKLGNYLLEISCQHKFIPDKNMDAALLELWNARQNAIRANPWFAPEFVDYNLAHWGKLLTSQNLQKWLEPYTPDIRQVKKPLIIGVVMAGNIPLVGFHDFLCVLLSGNRFLGKLSAGDNVLLPGIGRALIKLDNRFAKLISFSDSKLSGFDAVIATGSNNTSRYFEYYFRNYPHIIRHNRNGIAVLNGTETEEELEGLADDIFLYFGLGCRNVSKIYLPNTSRITLLLQTFNKYEALMMNSHKYMNNYTYQRSILLLNNVPHYDNGFILLTENQLFASPIGVINYEIYKDLESLKPSLELHKDYIQCILSNDDRLGTATRFGKSQQPELWDYADAVDTIKFLTSIENE